MIKLQTVDSKNGWVMLIAIEAATAAVYGPPCLKARYATYRQGHQVGK